MLYSVDSVDPEYSQENKTNDSIYLFCQFFVASSIERQYEIQTCLRKNVENPYIDNIVLMNERIYSPDELGVNSDKIIQVDIGRRLLYSDIVAYASAEINGYVVIANSDIFFDKSLGELRKSNIHLRRILYAQLRHEYNAANDKLSAIERAIPDAQDAWIFHTNHRIDTNCQRALQFPMGIPGCDNKMVHIANLLGFKVANEPRKIRCFHYHTSNVRSYTSDNRIQRPYAVVFPKNIAPLKYDQPGSLVPIQDDVSFYDNDVLREFLLKNADTTYTILQIGPESTYVLSAIMLQQVGPYHPDAPTFSRGIAQGIPGLKLAAPFSFVDEYMHAFSAASVYTVWDKRNARYYESAALAEHIKNDVNKRAIATHALEIYNYILANPWTNALKNTSILIISAHKTLIKSQIAKKIAPYGVPLFPGCNWLVMSPPSGESDFYVEMEKMASSLHRIKSKFDVALVDAGGYSVHICAELAKLQKSSIYVGEWLPLYFGIYTNTWMQQRPDVAYNMYVNSEWVLQAVYGVA